MCICAHIADWELDSFNRRVWKTAGVYVCIVYAYAITCMCVYVLYTRIADDETRGHRRARLLAFFALLSPEDMVMQLN